MDQIDYAPWAAHTMQIGLPQGNFEIFTLRKRNAIPVGLTFSVPSIIMLPT